VSESFEEISLADRLLLAEKIRGWKALVADEVAERLLQQPADWRERHGHRALSHGRDDAAVHLEYLVGAVVSGSVAAFEDYSRWTTRVLATYNVEQEFLEKSLRQLEACLLNRIEPKERGLISRLIEVGCLASAAPEEKTPQQTRDRHPLSDVQAVFLQALLAGARQEAVKIAVGALEDGHSIANIHLEVLQESQYAVGRLWESHQITVAQEHMASAITQYTLASLYPHIELATVVRGKALVTGVEGEMHQLGANMVADALESVGWDVKFLGTNLPQSGIVDMVREFQPALIGIAATMIFNVDKVASLVAAVQAIPDLPPPVIVLGGAAFRHAPNLYAEIGAHGQPADLKSLLALVDSLLPAP
jgi:methanogenic corrinoid protein MtbC1